MTLALIGPFGLVHGYGVALSLLQAHLSFTTPSDCTCPSLRLCTHSSFDEKLSSTTHLYKTWGKQGQPVNFLMRVKQGTAVIKIFLRSGFSTPRMRPDVESST